MDQSQSTMVESCWMLSSIFFILSLQAFTNQETARKGNYFGIYGIIIAIISTLFTNYIDALATVKFAIFIFIGGIIGINLALRVQMINIPQLVACLHSFVGIATIVVCYGSYFMNSYLGNDLGVAHNLELFLGVFIGSITFIGSLVAYGKLECKITSVPLILWGTKRHAINAVVVLAGCFLLVWYLNSPGLICLIMMTCLALFLGWHLVNYFEGLFLLTINF